MKLEEVIECINRHIERKRINNRIDAKGFLVLQKSITTKPVYRIFKEVTLTLWFVQKRHRTKFYTLASIEKIPEGQEDKVMNKLEQTFLEGIFDLMDDVLFKKVIDGSYGTDDIQ